MYIEVWTDPNEPIKLGIWPWVMDWKFGQFKYFEIPRYDTLYVLSLKLVGHEGQLPP